MSNFKILEAKLAFLRGFYETTTQPFREIKRKVESNEEPYVARGDPGDYDEPPFLEAWIDAQEGLTLQQQVCLTLLQRSFKEFLDGTIRQHPDYPSSRPQVKKGESWFKIYKQWFSRQLGVSWEEAPVSLERMEELSIARNCVHHGGESHGGIGDVFDSHRLVKKQSLNYHRRFPDAFFADESESEIWKAENYPQPVTISLTPEKVFAVIEDILAFCKFIDDRLPVSMR
jgi:hypothetical protein